LPLPLPLLLTLLHYSNVISTGVRILCGRSGETAVLAVALALVAALAFALFACHPRRGSAFAVAVAVAVAFATAVAPEIGSGFSPDNKGHNISELQPPGHAFPDKTNPTAIY
jgi:hypothetical protein